MEIGLIDFQGRWEGWETALSFSTLSTDRHFPPSASVATFVMRRYHRRSNGNSSGNVKIWVSFGPEVPSCHGRGRGFEPRRPRHTFQMTYGMIWRVGISETGCNLGAFCTQFAPKKLFRAVSLYMASDVTEKRKPTTSPRLEHSCQRRRDRLRVNV